MDDPQRQPGSGDRSVVKDRIKRALADGRISSADAAIRSGNVDSAQSMTELGLITRDLDQLEATLRVASEATPQVASSPLSAPTPPPYRAAKESSGRAVPFLILGVVVALIVAGAVALVFVGGGSDGKSHSSSSSQLQDPVSPGSQPSVPSGSPGAPGAPTPPSRSAYTLSASGLATFVTAYRQKFGTTRTIEMVFYPEYAITSVPQPKDRHSGWTYRDGEFGDFGGTTHNSPIDQAFDAKPLNVQALIANITRAKRVLAVEDGAFSHAIVSFVSAFDPRPTVRIYVSNQYNEGGYYTTTLGGKFLRKITY